MLETKSSVLPKAVMKMVLGVVVAIILIVLSFKLFESVDAGEIVVVQYPTGTMSVRKDAGLMLQMGGKATHYTKSNIFWYYHTKDKIKSGGFADTTDNSLPAMWNDGGKAWISGSVRYDMPITDTEIIKLHSIFGTQENIEKQLVKTNVEKSIFLTGPLMSSKESYAERKSDLIYLIEDQANKGVYRTKTIDIESKDPLTGEGKKEKVVEILEKDGVQLRQEKSSIAVYGLKLYNVAITNIYYDRVVEDQIKSQQSAIMSVQSAIANAKRAEQDAITSQKQGEANAAKAKWEIEVEKARSVTKAQANKAVAQEEVQTAQLNKQRDILEGEGIAAKKRLIMQADGALNEKLNAWVKSQEFMWDAFAKFQGPMVPTIVTGGGNGSNSNALHFMEMMGAKAAKDLALDLSNKK